MANCEQYWELISGCLDGDLTDEEQQRLDRHLAQCPECRAMWEQLSGLEAQLMELEAPSAGFTDRVTAAAAEMEQDIPFTNLPENRKPGQEARKQLEAWWKPVRNLVLAAACVLLILGMGSFVSRMFSLGSSNSSQATVLEESTAGSASQDSVSDSQAEEEALALHLEEGDYISSGQSSDALPEGFVQAGELSQEQAGGTGLEGCAYYTNPGLPGQCWVYQPGPVQGSGTYLLWVLEGS